MRYMLLCLALLLGACQDERSQAPTPEEDARLDEAEAMLDNAAVPPAKR